MAFLSLRSVISFLSCFFVAVVAAITLSITLTTSLSALRSIGERHAGSLLANANIKTEELFHGPADIVDTFKNLTRGNLWPWPSDDPATLQMWQQLHKTMFLSSEMTSAGLLQYFYDNTRMGAENLPEHPGYYGGSSLVPAPYSNGGIAYQRTQPVAVVPYTYNVKTHVQQKPGDPVYDAMLNDLPPALPRDGSFWASTLEPATLNGLATLTSGVYIFEQEGTILNYVPIVAPLYRLGATPGKDNVYSYIIAALYTDGISGFLHTVTETPNTVAFAYDNGGYLLASTYSTPFETTRRGSSVSEVPGPGCASSAATAIVETNYTYISCRAHVSKYAFAPLQAAASDTDFLTYSGKQVRVMTVDGDVWYAAVAQVTLRYPGIGVFLMLLLPEQDVIGDVVTGRNVAIGVTCGVFVVVAVLSFLLISLLLSPLTTVSDRMMKAALLEDDDDSRTVSAMQEVQQLQDAYYAMNDELNRIKSFVPQTVFAQRLSSLSDEELDAEVEAFNKERVKLNSESDRESTRSTKSRSSKAPSMSGASHVVISNTAMSFTHRPVSVLVMNFNGFTMAANGRDRDSFVCGVADAVAFIGAEVRSHNGVLQMFHGDHFTATFNAARPCAAHARIATTVGLRIISQAPTSGMRLSLRAGVATGTCLVGNLGSTDMKVFNTIGPVFMQACVLERMTRLYGVGCRFLAPKRTCVDIATHVRFRYVDIVVLPGSSKAIPIACIIEARREPGESREAEWLYVVGDVDDLNTQRNEGFLQLAQGHYPQGPMPSPVDSLSNSGRIIDKYDELIAQKSKNVEKPHSSLGKYYDLGYNVHPSEQQPPPL